MTGSIWELCQNRPHNPNLYDPLSGSRLDILAYLYMWFHLGPLHGDFKDLDGLVAMSELIVPIQLIKHPAGIQPKLHMQHRSVR